MCAVQSLGEIMGGVGVGCARCRPWGNHGRSWSRGSVLFLMCSGAESWGNRGRSGESVGRRGTRSGEVLSE